MEPENEVEKEEELQADLNPEEMEQEKEPETVSIQDIQAEHLKKSVEEASEFKNKYFLLLAELENTRKRLQKEKEEMTKFAVENVLCELLNPLDNIENAMGFTDQMSAETQNWVNGFKMLVAQFKDVLTNHGVTSFHSEGEVFNPHLHEAVEIEETQEAADGTIIKEFIKGYKCGERVLRPAKVKVAKAPKKEVQKEEEKKV